MIQTAYRHTARRGPDRPACRPFDRALANRSRIDVDTGTVIARIFDLLEGTGLEPFAAEVARGLIAGARPRSAG